MAERPRAVAADRYAAEYWAASGPDAATIAITARGLPYSQWWRKGHSHIDESEIWLVHGIAPGVKGVPKYEQISASGAKSEWPMYSADGKTLYYVSDRSGAREPVDSRRERRSRAAAHEVHERSRALAHDRERRQGDRVRARVRHLELRHRRGSRRSRSRLRCAARASGALVEHRTLTNGLQELAVSPDGKKVAFTVRGEDLRGVEPRRRKRAARVERGAHGAAARVGARQPPPRLRRRSRRTLHICTCTTS